MDKAIKPSLAAYALLGEQRYCWSQGNHLLAEAFLDRIGSDTDVLLALLNQEIELRQTAGETTLLEEYVARFPHLENELRALFQVHRIVQSENTIDRETVAWVPKMSVFPHVPGYEVLAELGRGGMGVVYMARNVRLNRVVALKMILVGANAGESELARFKIEAEAIARMHHPNIVQIYEVGEHAGMPFLSLEFCSGGSLARNIAVSPMSATDAAGLVEKLARGIHAAHERGVIHRDLKPANILLAEDGTPKITDFGLAKKVDSEASLTSSGAIMGTPSYMAPEQASGRSKHVGPQADVYALGAVLYALLTTRPPFKAETPVETVMQVISIDPIPPTRWQPDLPHAIETICLKCLQKDPQQRYQTAEALADDLRRFLASELIRAHPTTVMDGLKRSLRRWPALVALTGCCAFLLLLCVPTLVGLWLSAENRRQGAEQALAAERTKSLPLSSEWRIGAFNPNGTHVALCCGNLIRIRNVHTGQDVRTLTGHLRPVTCLAYSPDGTRIVSASEDLTLKVWDAELGVDLLTLAGHTAPAYTVGFTSNGLLASASVNELRFWDATAGKEIRTVPVKHALGND
jgi:serine/threonine protein kinase